MTENAAQAADWDGPIGEHWAKHADVLETELDGYGRLLRQAANIGATHRVLDIGCGTGKSTRDAARVAVSGSAHGVDLSARMLEVARRRAAEEGLGNVTFEHANAQVHRFPQQRFDLAMSRFGTMFFDDPVGIGRAHV